MDATTDSTKHALGAVLVQRVEPHAPTPVLLAWAIPPGGIALHLVSLLIVGELYAAITVTVPAILAVAYLAFAVNVLGYTIFFTLLGRIGAFEVSLINYIQSITAALIGFVALGERLQPLTVVGFGVILVGFLLVKRAQVRNYLATADLVK